MALVLLALFNAFLSQEVPREVTAIRAGRVITISGGEIENATILIEDGHITAVGAGIEVPPNATVIDASRQVVMPGIVDGSSQIGLEGSTNEETSEITPHVRILDALNPTHGTLTRALRSGVTSACICPGNRSVISGLASVIKTAGASERALILREDVALKAAMGSIPTMGNFPPRGTPPTSFYARRPTTRMGVVWEFRKAFFDARDYREEGFDRKDPRWDILLRALDGKLVVRVAASHAADIETAVRLAEEFGLSLQLEEAHEAYRHIALLSRKKIAVFLRPEFRTSTLYAPEGSVIRFTTFNDLVAAGVRTALLSLGQDEGEGHLAMAAFAVKHGAPRAAALRAITLTPAELLGVEERVGSITPGKDADLLFLSGDPLDVTTRIERVMVSGTVVAGNLKER